MWNHGATVIVIITSLARLYHVYLFSCSLENIVPMRTYCSFYILLSIETLSYTFYLVGIVIVLYFISHRDSLTLDARNFSTE